MSALRHYLKTNRQWILIVAVIATINAFLNIGVLVTEDLAHHQDIEWTFYIINEFSGTFTEIIFIPFLILVFKKYPLSSPGLFPKIGLYLFSSIIFGLLHTSLMYASRVPLYKLAGISRLDEIFNDLPYRYAMEYFKQFLTFWLIYIIYWAVCQYQLNQNRLMEQIELKEALLKAQVQSLQMQLHPHFFFNTLNTISSLMYHDPGRADKLISRLSDFLRNVISLRDRALHSLEKELQLLQQFTDVMLERYPDKLNIHFDVPQECRPVEVPVLLLQPIVENAIKYSIDYRPTTKVKIRALLLGEVMTIEVSDNGPGIQEGDMTPGTGLSSTLLRLKKLYRDQYTFDMHNRNGGGLSVSLSLPKRYAT